jgi:hypothetical protein
MKRQMVMMIACDERTAWTARYLMRGWKAFFSCVALYNRILFYSSKNSGKKYIEKTLKISFLFSLE